MPIADDDLQLAIKNVAEFGDTDVFPYPLENHWFFDQPSEVFNVLSRIRGDQYGAFQWMPLFFSNELSNSGSLGYRPATQIDPLWNAYFLASVISLAPAIEPKRQPSDRVFSYRYSPDLTTGALFAATGWKDFQEQGLRLSDKNSHMAMVDISDFYSRAYHHRLENTLLTVCNCEPATVKFVDSFLSRLNGDRSFGLPVGGPASRILAEALLIRTDRLLEVNRVPFIRFVDDYMLFGTSEDQVRSSILCLSRLLLDNEGLSLNRNKTRFMSCGEFRQQSVYADASKADSEQESMQRLFLQIHLKFDPYSPTATEDYESLQKAVGEYDILGMLDREVQKSRVDRFAMTQIVKSLRFLPAKEMSAAILTIASNLRTLSPIFATVALAFKQLHRELDTHASEAFFRQVRELVESRSPLIAASGTLAYAVRLLAFDPHPDAEIALNDVYFRQDRTPLLDREVCLAMARRGAHAWLSDARNRFASITNPWSKRALLASSFVLGDEGNHWRSALKKQLPAHDQKLLEWMNSKNSGKNWEIPL